MTKACNYNYSVHSKVYRPERDDVMLRRWRAVGGERLWDEVTHSVKLFKGEQFGRQTCLSQIQRLFVLFYDLKVSVLVCYGKLI